MGNARAITSNEAGEKVGYASNVFNDAETLRELHRILDSLPFRDSQRLRSFLTFVVETTLAGNADRIKAYTVAVEALGRDESFNPETDPIVRVEAGRLQRGLARYYAEAGRDDQIVIALPRGTYVPVFEPRGPPADAASNGQASPAAAKESFEDSLNSILIRLVELCEIIPSLVGPAQISSEDDPHDETSVWLSGDRRATDAARLRGPKPDTDRDPGDPPPPLGGFIRGAMTRVAASARSHARVFRLVFYVVCALSVLIAVFDIDRPFAGGPNQSWLLKLWSKPPPTPLH
jgi:hypothetical protein